MACLAVVLLSACADGERTAAQEESVSETVRIVEAARVYARVGDIPPPDGFVRPVTGDGFADYLRDLPLDTADNIVHLYNGAEKGNQKVHYAIIDMDVGERDLQQCADAVMRLWGEYLYRSGRQEAIRFLLTNGDWAAFSKYAEGYRAAVNGQSIQWVQSRPAGSDYAHFRQFMDFVFIYAGTYSLSKQLESVDDFEDIRSGDVLLQGGFPGHAVIVADRAVHQETGAVCYMLAQSYMPAQEIHLLLNGTADSPSPWFFIPEGTVVSTPEWQFLKDNLMRFPDF